MSTLPVSASAEKRSIVRAFREYLAERFPVPVTAMLSLGTGLGAYACAQQASIAAGAPLVLDGTAFGGCLMAFLFLLHLRVFDEHKDFQIDAETRPDRPVQRGVVSLGQLKVLGAIAITGQVALALLPGVSTGWLYAIPLAYSVLMLYEFFAPEWLSARIALYALTHTFVMVLVAWALGARALGTADLAAVPPALWGFLALNVTAFIGVDVLRKTWAPESEVEGLDSYSSRFGPRKAAVIGALVIVASAVAGGYTGWQLGGRAVWLAVVAAVTLWGLATIRSYAVEPTVKRAKMLEAVAGVHLLALFFGVAVVAAVQHGVAIGIASHGFTLGV